jgi:DNA-binding XRE family transcriptional regulator
MVRKGSCVVNESPNPTDQHVGKRVRMRRLMLDMSQTDLAVRLV